MTDDQIALIKNGEPTTHILKVSIQGLEGTVQNEVFCESLAARIGLRVPEVSFASSGDTQYILVKRFDRLLLSDQSVQRLHQEGFCQALSIPPELKYEDEGGLVSRNRWTCYRASLINPPPTDLPSCACKSSIILSATPMLTRSITRCYTKNIDAH